MAALPFFVGASQGQTTQDVDASLFVPAGTESEVVQTLLSEFNPRIPDAAEFAMKSRVKANADIDRETVANRSSDLVTLLPESDALDQLNQFFSELP